MKPIKLTIREEPGAQAAKAAFAEMARRLFHLDGPFFMMDFGDDGVVTLEVKTFDGKIRLSFITVPEKYRGKGLASKALDFLTNIADKYGVKITLDADPQGEGGLTKGQLFKWYQRHGFRRLPYSMQDELSDAMEREPKGRAARIADRVAREIVATRLTAPPRMVDFVSRIVMGFSKESFAKPKIFRMKADLRGWDGPRGVVEAVAGKTLFLRLVSGGPRNVSGDYANGILTVYVGRGRRIGEWEAREVAEHELIHFVQEAMEDSGKRYVREDASNPGVSQHEVGRGKSWDTVHDLDDEEFYPELNTVVRWARKTIEEGGFSGRESVEVLKAITGESGPTMGVGVDPVMRRWKRSGRGKWEVAVRELHRVLGVKGVGRVATRPIRLDRSAAARSIGKLVRYFKTGYWGRHPEEPIRDELGFVDKVMVTGVDGKEFEVEVQYRSEYSPDNLDMVLGGGSGKTTKTKRPAVIVMLNGVLTSSVFTTTTSGKRFKDEVMAVLEHELTHQADSYLRFVGPTTQDRIKSEGELDLPEYYNSPHEVRGYMRSVFEEVMSCLPKIRPHFTTSEIMRRLAFFSPIWKRIEPHLREENRKLILKGVYQAVEDWTAEQGLAKAASELEFVVGKRGGAE